MIAANFLKNPEALIAQKELELVFAAKDEITEKDMVEILKTFQAGSVWINAYATKLITVITTPAWFKKAKELAKKLAVKIKKSIMSLF